MKETVRAWLNGTRDYYMGIELFKILSNDKILQVAFSKGETPFNSKRLQEEMLKIFNSLNTSKSLKAKEDISTSKTFVDRNGNAQSQTNREKASKIFDVIANTATKIMECVAGSNPELYNVTREKAISKYKQAMDKRAIVFNMVPSEAFADQNKPDDVLARSPLCLEVVKLYNEASQLFDDADYVKIHGRLPDQEPEPEEDPIDKLQPHEVKQALDNARKAFNKLKGKEETPERLVLKQKHLKNIEKLEAKWHSLKHTQ